MKTLGILTIGQSPRPDILGDLLPVFGGHMEIIETGALDGLTVEEIQALQPGEEDRLLVTKLADGSVVHVAEEALMTCMQEKIDKLEAKGAACIFILCTARFRGLSSNVPLIEPGQVLNETIPQQAVYSSIGVLSPAPEQVEATKRDWQGIVDHLEILTASPYGPVEDIETAAKKFSHMDIDLVVLDCMGYSEEIRQKMAEMSGKPVILSKILAAEKAAKILEE